MNICRPSEAKKLLFAINSSYKLNYSDQGFEVYGKVISDSCNIRVFFLLSGPVLSFGSYNQRNHSYYNLGKVDLNLVLEHWHLIFITSIACWLCITRIYKHNLWNGLRQGIVKLMARCYKRPTRSTFSKILKRSFFGLLSYSTCSHYQVRAVS